MSKETIPDLVVDFHRNRIRIPKAALRMMNCPKFVRLLINTDEKYAAVTIGMEGDSLSHRVPDYIFSSKSSFEICSQSFVRQLLAFGNFSPTIHSCALKACACLDEQFIVFSFSNMTIVEMEG